MARNSSQFRVNAVRGMSVAVALALGTAALPLQAQEQVDISGSWVAPGTENIMERAAGPVTGNFTGMPINANERALADSYNSGMLAEPERICQLYNQWELADGPWNLRFWPQVSPYTREIVAWVIEGTESQAGTTVWMDGRPQPSKIAPHDRAAFSTGSWVGNMLVVHTTDMKSAALRRNGVFNSDEATMTDVFAPHGDLLTATYVLQDPVYLTEPYIYARSYNRSAERPVSPHWDPCIVNYEGVDEGHVSFYLPGKNPLLDQMMQIYHIPEYASQGGAATMYPEIRDRMKAQFVASYHTFPKKCTLYCSTGFQPPPPPKTAGKASAAHD
jgi:hypothetical protein